MTRMQVESLLIATDDRNTQQAYCQQAHYWTKTNTHTYTHTFRRQKRDRAFDAPEACVHRCTRRRRDAIQRLAAAEVCQLHYTRVTDENVCA